ncbi:hypothetical protein JJB11_14440 [Ramlibacter ginsenosidimutans]|uniref:Response regulator n=1 Tax=Ramlibacter ginsenosidimutans TaxID=502333 RepID=A0A934WN45_9BURK|nr:hypothetical protein [Ramlibacter ginsenosidimutans]MBK6007296.1 hypothetical protein [Ramlibacter ginsenosidimutans]
MPATSPIVNARANRGPAEASRLHTVLKAEAVQQVDLTSANFCIIATDEDGIIRQALDAGFFNYMTKPIVVGPFMDALGMALTAHAAATTRKDPQ